jgi:hypothetical protein
MQKMFCIKSTGNKALWLAVKPSLDGYLETLIWQLNKNKRNFQMGLIFRFVQMSIGKTAREESIPVYKSLSLLFSIITQKTLNSRRD